jgi:hypothetical protein
VTTNDPFATAEPKPSKDPRKSAYNEAQTALRQAHPDEYTALLRDALERRGLSFKPRLSAEEREAKDHEQALEKARAKAAALVEEFGPAVIAGIA